MACLPLEAGPCPPLRTVCLSLDTAPCPPPFVANIYDIFVDLAVNQSLSIEEYTAIAINCNIFPSTTTSVTSASELSTTVTSLESSTPTDDVYTTPSITSTSDKQSTTSSVTSTSRESTMTTSELSSFEPSTPTDDVYTTPSITSTSDKQSTTSSVASTSTESTMTSSESSSFKPSTPTDEVESTTLPATSSSIEETTRTFVTGLSTQTHLITSESSMTEFTSKSSITTTEEGTTISSARTTPIEETMSSVEITSSKQTPAGTTESSATYSTSLPTTSSEVRRSSTESYVVTSDSSKSESTSTSSVATTQTEATSSTSVKNITSTGPTETPALSTAESTSELHITTAETESPSSSANYFITTSESPMTESTSKSSVTTATKLETTTRPTTQTTMGSTSSSVESSGSSAETSKTTLAPTIITSSTTYSSLSSASILSSSSSSKPTSTITSSRAALTTAVPSVTTREQYSSTASAHSTTVQPEILTTDQTPRPQPAVLAANSCNAACQITVVCCVSLLVALCILTFSYLKIQQARKHRKVKFRSHQYGKTYPANRLYDNVMNGSFRTSSWNFYNGHSRSSSETSFTYVHEPLRFVNQIYLPDTTIVTDISEKDRHTTKHYLKRSTSSEIRRTTKPKISQSLSLDSYASNRVDKLTRDPLYKKHSRPTRSSVQRRGHKSGHTRSRSMGNPYSTEEYDSGSSFDSNGPIPYDGPITFTPDLSRRPFPKISSELRREMIEQTRDSRRDLNDDQSRRRSRSHDPSLVTRGYIERQFSFDLDPDCPDYRPLGRYKKHNPRVRKVSTVSREFNIDNINRYASELEMENNYLSYDDENGNWPHNANRTSLRNRNKEQKVINSILKNNKPPNNRSRSDCSGDGLRNDHSAADVFTPSRDRSQSYGATLDDTVNTQKPNTIYFYQTRL